MQIYSSTPNYNEFNIRIRKLAQQFHLISFEQTAIFTFLHCSPPSMPPQLASVYLKEPQELLNVCSKEAAAQKQNLWSMSGKGRPCRSTQRAGTGLSLRRSREVRVFWKRTLAW
jgi:hypothetical protein